MCAVTLAVDCCVTFVLLVMMLMTNYSVLMRE